MINDHEAAMARQKEILAMTDDDRNALEEQLSERARRFGLEMIWPIYELYRQGCLVFDGNLFEVEQYLNRDLNRDVKTEVAEYDEIDFDSIPFPVDSLSTDDHGDQITESN